ncbi:MAG: crossover junction endodeoxyribonuclease RuvC [Nitrospiraceae bacterium]|nr:MAG: crossover junction endodeoxyribonuclease RuvC [Nitrospiraceae bacterium]
MRIIGIDPGTVCCGYGLVERKSQLIHVASGEIRMNQKTPLPERLKVLHDSLNTVIHQYKPSHLCIEKIFYHKSIRSALALGSTRGVVLLLAAQNNIPVFEYNSTELKMALTGYGRAEKRQVQHMVKILLNLNSSPMSEDSTDALALCICHINSSFKLK